MKAISSGLLVFFSLAIAVYISLQVNDRPNSKGGFYELRAYADDASGLVPKSKVVIAGIPVGYLEDVRLQGSRALIIFKVSSDLQLGQDSFVLVAKDGLLGDAQIVVNSGRKQPWLKDGDFITVQQDTSGVAGLTNKMGEITSDVKAITSAMRELVAGDIEKPAKQRSAISQLITNLSGLVEDVRGVADQNRGDVGNMVKDLAVVVHEMREIMQSDLKGKAVHGVEKVVASMDKIESMMTRLDNTMAAFEKVANNIRKGEGTLGKLVSDNSAYDNINQSLRSVNQLLGRVSAVQTYVDFRSDYLLQTRDSRSQFNITIQPREDMSYDLGMVFSPYGSTSFEQRYETIDGVGKSTNTVLFNPKGIRLNANYVYHLSDFSFRIGLMETTGGLGVAYKFWQDQIKIKALAFDFGKELPANLRFTLEGTFFKVFYVSFGLSDLLMNTAAAQNYRLAYNNLGTLREFSYQVGLGLHFNDETLRSLIGFIGMSGMRP